MMQVLRTPDSRFAQLPNYPFAPRYVSIGGIRIHYVDAGPTDAAPILLLHGEPTWSYLYRHMIPVLSAAGHRVVAPDLVGFGRSDKPAHRADYTYQRFVDWLAVWLRELDLSNITLFGQDWGAFIGLRLAGEYPQRFSRLIIANGALPSGDRRLPLAFRLWLFGAHYLPILPIGMIMRAGCRRRLDAGVLAAYKAPFPDARYQAGARALPQLVPIHPNDPAAPANRRAWMVLRNWRKPLLTAFSDGDPFTRGLERAFQNQVPGARAQAHVTIHNAGHFLQEDRGEELAHVVDTFIAANPA